MFKIVAFIKSSQCFMHNVNDNKICPRRLPAVRAQLQYGEPQIPVTFTIKLISASAAFNCFRYHNKYHF